MWKINIHFYHRFLCHVIEEKINNHALLRIRNLVIFWRYIISFYVRNIFSLLQEKSTDYLCTVSLFLHFALRRARILRPVQLDILSRNPCLFILDLRLYFLILLSLLAIVLTRNEIKTFYSLDLRLSYTQINDWWKEVIPKF